MFCAQCTRMDARTRTSFICHNQCWLFIKIELNFIIHHEWMQLNWVTSIVTLYRVNTIDLWAVLSGRIMHLDVFDFVWVCSINCKTKKYSAHRHDQTKSYNVHRIVMHFNGFAWAISLDILNSMANIALHRKLITPNQAIQAKVCVIVS